MPNQISRAAALVAFAVLAAGCEQGESGAPLTGPAGEMEISSALGYQPGWSSPNHDDLLELLEQEKTRISDAQESTKDLADSLNVVWEDFLKKEHEQYESPFLMCEPLTYTADTKIIGPEGGAMGIGPHKLTIPEGALTQYTVITGELPVSTKTSVKLSPHGLEFLEDAIVEIN